MSILTSKQGFVNAVAEQGALWRLLWILERPGGSDDASLDSQGQNDMLKKQRGWTFLESLSSSPTIALKVLESSAWLELLGILVGYSEFTKVWIARSGAAKILSRLLWDPKTGQTLGRLRQLLPCGQMLLEKKEAPLVFTHSNIIDYDIISTITRALSPYKSYCCFEGRGSRYHVESI